MIMLLTLALAAPHAATAIPETVPIYCLDDKEVAQPVQRTSYARLTAAFRTQMGLGTRRLSRSTTRSGTLTFRGGERGAEYIFYDVEPHDGARGLGILLTGMHVRLGGVSDDLSGDNMCWRTFGIVNAQ